MGQYDPIIDAASSEWDIDPNLVRAVMAQESGGNPGAVSKAGALGLMGIMPDTGRGLGATNLADPAQNIWAGVKYLAQARDAEASPADALRYYHGGPGWRGAYGPESAAYAPSVAATYQKLAASTPAASKESPPVPDDSARRAEEFLNRTAPTSAPTAGPTAAADDGDARAAAFLARTAPGGETPPPSTTPNPDAGLNEYGIGGDPQQFNKGGPGVALPVPDPIRPVGNILSAGVKGAVEGFGHPLGQTILSPEAQAQLDAIQRQGGLKGWSAGLASTIAGDIGTGGAAVLGAGNALLRGAQGVVAQTGAELGAPQLGRDLAALPEAFAGTPELLRPMTPDGIAINKLDPAAVSRARAVVSEMTPAERETFAARVAGPVIADTAAPTALDPNGTPTMTVRPGEAGPSAGMGGPVPQAAGAQTSTTTEATMTPAEIKANRRQAEKAQILAPAEPGDTTIHVEGSLPTKAEYAGDPVVSQQENMLRQRNPDAFEGVDGRLTANNAARVAKYEDMTPSDTALQRMEADRSTQAQADNAAIMEHARPADAQPALDALDAVLNDKRNMNRESVQKNLAAYRDRLFDADGNLKTDPQELWGIRDDLTEKLDKIGTDPQSTMGYVKKETLAFRNAIDDVLNKATDNHFQTFLDNYASRSQEINAGNVLRQYRDKLTNAKGDIQAQRFHKFVTDLAEHRGDKGIDPAMDISDETMRGLISIDTDLKRAGQIDLGKARGSPTDLFGTLAKGMGIVGAHVGALATSPGIGNLVVQNALKSGDAMLGNLRLRSQTKKHLAPPPGGYVRALDPNAPP